MTFRKGQELVCVVHEEEWIHVRGRLSPPSMPQKNEIYHFDGYAQPFNDGTPSIYLTEFPDGWNFDAEAFRPVQRTNISIFTEILERETIPSTEKEKV